MEPALQRKTPLIQYGRKKIGEQSQFDIHCWRVAETAFRLKAEASGFDERWGELPEKARDKWFKYAKWVLRAIEKIRG